MKKKPKVEPAAKSTYPGQCVHEWVAIGDSKFACAKAPCTASCRRGEDGKIEDYEILLPKEVA